MWGWSGQTLPTTYISKEKKKERKLNFAKPQTPNLYLYKKPKYAFSNSFFLNIQRGSSMDIITFIVN